MFIIKNNTIKAKKSISLVKKHIISRKNALSICSIITKKKKDIFFFIMINKATILKDFINYD